MPVSVRILFVLFSHLQFYVRSNQDVLIEESAAIDSLQAPIGGAVELPCDVTPTMPNDSMGLVIWYKQGHETPIYTFDSREGVTSHWSNPATLGVRAIFYPHAQPAVLEVSKLRPEDSGQYRCRVDFVKSPTKNTRLNLTVLVPPERLIIFTQADFEIEGDVIGPYDEGTEVNLTCVAIGGHPTARVSWWKSHGLLANSEKRATMSFKLQRSDLGTKITCQAVTDPSITPMSRSLSVDINLRPLWVRLLGGKRPLVAGRSTELVCQSSGARPKPSITWWMGDSRLKSTRETSSSDGNITSSILTFFPAIEDAGKMISCRVLQKTLMSSPYEDGWKIDVQHVPVVTLELGAKLDARKVVEGSDVYLDCRVRANPWYSHLYFTHNGITVKPGPGVVLANQSLVLQRVSRRASGGYVCLARNNLGEGSSERLTLDVKYSPSCKSSQAVMLRAAKGESIEISCDLDANPKEPMSYSWWFNSSTHTKRELTTTVANSTSSGTLMYTINTSGDYGWVQCSGNNSVGWQPTPCLYQILPAEKPSAVKSCDVTNVTYDSITVKCTPGHDGGMRQSFSLQVFDVETGTLLRNESSNDPVFIISDLISNKDLSLSIRAQNEKGVSEPLRLTSRLLEHPQRMINEDKMPLKVELTTALLVVLSAVGIIALLTTVSVAIFCCRFCKNKENDIKKKDELQGEMCNAPLTSSKDTETLDSLDKNPDVIPLDGKISDTCSNKSSATDYSSIRPLISRTMADKYDLLSQPEDRFYDANINSNHYIQLPTLGRMPRPMNQSCFMPTSNLGPTIECIGPMNSLSKPNVGHDCQRLAHDQIYGDWLANKSLSTLHTDMLPMEQILPPEPYANPTPSLSYNNRNPTVLQRHEFKTKNYLEPRSLLLNSNIRCSNSPEVRLNPENSSVFYNQAGQKISSLPHLSGVTKSDFS